MLIDILLAIVVFVGAVLVLATTVTWAMDGASPFMMKVMRVFVNMDKMLGKDFDLGLANLKATTEK